MLSRFLLLLSLFVAVPAKAIDVLDVSPLQATPQDMIRMTVHFGPGLPLEAVRTFRYGSSIQVFVIINDVAIPGQPPAPERTEAFELGQFPVGEYQIDIYNSSPSSTPMASYPLSVVAPVSLPATSASSRLLLVLCVLAGAWAVPRVAGSRST